MKKFERFFIVLGIITTVVLSATAFLFWVKHALEFVVEDLDDIFGEDEKGVEPEVVERKSTDDLYDGYESI